jgi:hypothetical protein
LKCWNESPGCAVVSHSQAQIPVISSFWFFDN